MEAVEVPDNSQLLKIMQILPIGVVVHDDAGNVLLSNERALDHGVTQGREASAWLKSNPVESSASELRVSDTNRAFQTTRHHISASQKSLLLSTSFDVTEQKSREDYLWRCAFFDDLTGLPNRKFIEEHVNARASRDDASRFALVFLDVDHFKHINDFYGHSIGDGLLVEMTKRLTRSLREQDLLARISGDEFLLVLDPVSSQEEAQSVLHALLESLRRPFFVEEFEVLTSASAGMSLYPDHDNNYESLRQKADIAMYKVKGQQRGGAAVFDESMQQEAVMRRASESRLRQAILDRRFCCAYQPKVNIRTNEVEGVEALVRLIDNDGEIQGPDSFVQLAVELGLIDDLTQIVLDEICDSMGVIDDVFGANVKISLNVAASQAVNHKFMTDFAERLKRTNIPQRFMLEITEDAFISKSLFQDDVLPLLRDLGVGVSIDDFGIGYSSLSALADITADEIKIDRSFITDIHKRPRSQSILKSIESLAEALNMKIVAEGVETFEEVAYLQAATKIRVAQGYYFSKPCFIDEFRAAGPIDGHLQNASFSRGTAGREAITGRPVQLSRIARR
jgi:c-di-GMP phosphodiesterase Gmr